MDSPREPIDSYDYIICGGGTSGCVAAGRLAENPNVKVLLLEAGQHNKDLETVHMVGGFVYSACLWIRIHMLIAGSWSNNFDSETDWNMITPPMKGVNSRQVKLSRGRFLGGCSGCNGTLCIRGCKQDFDDWGLAGWSGEEFFHYMRKAETFHPKPWFKADTASHGYSGPLHTEPHDLAPISQYIMDSFVSAGLPLVPDMFSTGETPHGCGHAPRTVYNGLRTTSADFVTNGYQRKNVTVVTGATVDKVLVEAGPGSESEGLRATGVVVRNTADGSVQTYHARREVVLSGGAYCSPAILLRSGIGARAELEKHDIPCLLDFAGVGQNLMDHPIVFMFYETTEPNITTDHLVYHNDAFNDTYNLWKTEKKGFLSTFPFGAFAYARLDDRLAHEPIWQQHQQLDNGTGPGNEKRDPMNLLPSKQPNTELFTTECYGGPKQYDQFPANPDKHVFSIIAELFSPRSRGSVTLSSKDAVDNPIVDCNYLDHPLDMLVLSEGCRFANEIVMKGAGTKRIVKGSYPEGLGYGIEKNGVMGMAKREDWVPYVKEHATTCEFSGLGLWEKYFADDPGYHAAGTCAMGNDDNPNAVLDNKLRVRGVANLRVADCSVMPTLHGGHTQMPAYGIGEKCADLIKEAWSVDRVNQGLRAAL